MERGRFSLLCGGAAEDAAGEGGLDEENWGLVMDSGLIGSTD